MTDLSLRFEEALVFATQLHNTQKRKGSEIPYISHLLAVTALVLENGGDEDQAIAALLHDAAEDQGGEPIIIEIGEKFGNQVAEIVKACSDTFQSPKPPWRQRKEKYLLHLETAPPKALLVSLADKVHNAQSIVMNHKEIGDQIWNRFRGKKNGTLWYYRELGKSFQKLFPGPLSTELSRLITTLESLS